MKQSLFEMLKNTRPDKNILRSEIVIKNRLFSTSKQAEDKEDKNVASKPLRESIILNCIKGNTTIHITIFLVYANKKQYTKTTFVRSHSFSYKNPATM